MRSNDQSGTKTFVGLAALLGAMLSGCGGGDASPTPTPAPTSSSPTDQQRAQAATQTAQSNASCTTIQPFYWEVRNSNVLLTGGTVGGATSARRG